MRGETATIRFPATDQYPGPSASLDLPAADAGKPAQRFSGQGDPGRRTAESVQADTAGSDSGRARARSRDPGAYQTDCGERGAQTDAGFFGITLRLTTGLPLLLMMHSEHDIGCDIVGFCE